mmetsp:Transcript_16579/g.51876  ORF Transcript_16579/g.51876 Transcript_16579/m.51876 type:complete len:80 (+) Transcript_16579:171-410(+)
MCASLLPSFQPSLLHLFRIVPFVLSCPFAVSTCPYAHPSSLANHTLPLAPHLPPPPYTLHRTIPSVGQPATVTVASSSG